MPAATQQDINDFQNALAKAEKDVKDLKDKLDKQPSSNDKGLLEAFLNSKLGFISKCSTLVGALTITTQELKDFREKMKSNVENLKEKLKILGGIVLDLAEELVGLIVDIGKEFIEIVEKVEKGIAKIKTLSATKAQISGETGALRLTFGPRLQRAGFPKSAGPFTGTWTASVEQTGTDVQGNTLYRIVEYECASEAVPLGPVVLRSLRQTLDVERVSTCSVSREGVVQGTLHSHWTSTHWPNDTSPVLATTRFTGSVSGDTFTYQSEGEDYVFLSHFFPDKAVEGMGPKVINSAGAVSEFNPNRFAGNLTLDRNADPSHVRLLTDALQTNLPKPTLVTTDQLRRASELIHANPFVTPVATILGSRGG